MAQEIVIGDHVKMAMDIVHYAYNHLTEEQRPITEQQYDDDNTITSDGQLNI